MKLWTTTIGALLMAAFAASAHAGTVPKYTVQSFATSTSTTPGRVSSNGQMVGLTYVGSNLAAFITSGNSSAITPPINGVVYAQAINASGQIAGNSSLNYPGSQVYFASGGTITALGLGGGYSALGNMNDSGVVVGSAQTASGEVHAFYSSNGGAAQDLGTLSGGTSSYAYGVNAAGDAVGQATAANGVGHAVIYKNNSIIDIGGAYSDSGWSSAHDINSSGQVAGTMQYDRSFNGSVSFVWDNGNYQVLSMYGAVGIDDSGTVVGYNEFGTTGMIWRDGSYYYLQDVLATPNSWSILSVEDVNGAGQISAWGCNAAGSQCGAILLTPVPEPETYAMLLGGLALCGLLARRRKLAA
ncbi:FxDxF family PEP-CTERM protein [Duganella radicis]|nr:FxDxF family PEP-CTERM protein [Duganella radicis]